ncbi:MAG TPA: GNAT family N-acetyltransferase [Aggregatilineales bacterium]|nr:GNAT family N-acetyltransferase [Aggregatilineales bacterium]
MKIELHHEPKSFEILRPEWNTLVSQSGANTPFNTWEFLATWWEVYGTGQLWLVTARSDSGELIGIAPFFLNEDKVLGSIGGLDVTDYCDVIIHSDHTKAVYEALAEFFVAHKGDFAGLSAYNLRPTSHTLSLFCEALEAKGAIVTQSQIEVTPQIALPATMDGYFELLDKKQRGELRRKMRRAEAGEDETIDWYVVGAEHDIQAEIQRFFALMASSSPQKAEFLQNPQHKAFFEKLIPRMLPTGWLQLAFLCVDGEATASYFNFDYDRQIWVYNSGLSYKYDSLSTGIVLITYLIEDAIKRGYTIFDILRGNEGYKYRLGGVDVPLYQLDAKF